MNKTIIHDLPDWQVTSYGNGLAYELANKRTLEAVFFQGDDAENFRDSLAVLTEPRAGSYSAVLGYSDALGCIWSDYMENAQDWGVKQ